MEKAEHIFKDKFECSYSELTVEDDELPVEKDLEEKVSLLFVVFGLSILTLLN